MENRARSASLSPDGNYLFFSSTRKTSPDAATGGLTYARIKAEQVSPGNGGSDIYWVDASVIDELRPE